MRPIPVEQLPIEQPRAVMMLDDVELALQLNDLAESTASTAPGVPSTAASDFLTELYSCASMIMDREEFEAMAKEFAAFGHVKTAA